ncbi:MAG: hypothetical protein A3A43_02005 [Candidatus Liptonbacteria bacterium RIFCSPLOWO2_01_FULL_56_20]|uniref:Uncharacterized protein n=1 Tax=Candidatus Liptonbacteria bacterium RIFCSPLOWO2_01_FULL_56_20 TaxID=1798652 RepID=A0A1G2CIT3_9BACT|nr:MAG: hypothetical protein A3A43_02005 [Candidatus Liptonbacteria bacterium RIFCSPLOWO2_01_FULL_56_20]
MVPHGQDKPSERAGFLLDSAQQSRYNKASICVVRADKVDTEVAMPKLTVNVSRFVLWELDQLSGGILGKNPGEVAEFFIRQALFREAPTLHKQLAIREQAPKKRG